MKNTKDIKLDKLKVLVYGGMGTSKTRFAGTFPDPVMLDFDRGSLSIKSAGGSIDYEDFVGPNGYDQAEVLNFIKTHTTSGKYKTIILDSITTLSNRIMSYTLELNGRKGGRPVLQDWGDQMRYLEEIVLALTTSPINCVVVAHDQLDKDELSGRSIASPLVTGKLSKKIPVYFDEIYYSEKVVSGKESNYRMLTKHSGLFPARSRLNLPEYISPDYSEILKVINKQGKVGGSGQTEEKK